MSFFRTGSWSADKAIQTFGKASIAGMKRHASISTPIGECDISWLEAAAAAYKISADPYNYIFSVNRIVVADVPNRNMDAFPKAELLKFHGTAGRPVYQTFIGKPLYYEHNQVPEDARGVIFKSFLVSEGPYLVVLNLVGADTRKDGALSEDIKSGRRPFFSMGCLADAVECPFCKKVARDTNEFCQHISKQLGQIIGDQLIYEILRDITFIEESSVADPAALIAGKSNLDLQNGRAVPPRS
jgi:hypothetical protein